jgi:hypothetical protein
MRMAFLRVARMLRRALRVENRTAVGKRHRQAVSFRTERVLIANDLQMHSGQAIP